MAAFWQVLSSRARPIFLDFHCIIKGILYIFSFILFAHDTTSPSVFVTRAIHAKGYFILRP